MGRAGFTVCMVLLLDFGQSRRAGELRRLWPKGFIEIMTAKVKQDRSRRSGHLHSLSIQDPSDKIKERASGLSRERVLYDKLKTMCLTLFDDQAQEVADLLGDQRVVAAYKVLTEARDKMEAASCA